MSGEAGAFAVGHRVAVNNDRDVTDLNGYYGHITHIPREGGLIWVDLQGRVTKPDEWVLRHNPWPFWPKDIIHVD